LQNHPASTGICRFTCLRHRLFAKNFVLLRRNHDAAMQRDVRLYRYMFRDYLLPRPLVMQGPQMPTSRPFKPTLRTVAAETGLAVTTVSRALADDPRIATGTRARVVEAAARLGYVPDRAAQRLRTGRTKVLTVLLNFDHEFLGFTNELLAGMSAALAGTGYSVTVLGDTLHGDRAATVRHILRHRMADGLLLTRIECFDPRVRLLLEHEFPFVTHGRTEFTSPHPWVDFDNEAYARAAVARLVARGRRRLTVVLPAERFTFGQHLRYGFLSAVRAAGVAHEIAEGLTLDAGAQAIAAHLRARLGTPDGPDGVVCVGEVSAMAALAALADVGRRAGVDADIVAKRGSPVFDLLRPQVDTVAEDLRGTGRRMAELLLRRIDGEPAEALQELLPAEPAWTVAVGA
jgi:LacI family transcriptional regulator